MANIIAGRFETKAEADSAASSLADFAGRDDIFIFFNNQPGAHDSDHDAANAGDEGAAKGAATGAASGVVVGATIGTLVGGPAGGGIGAAVGGYAGSLYGAASGLSEEGEATNQEPRPRSAGMMVAVRVAKLELKQRIIDSLKHSGAKDIESAQGAWENGEWVDFDPVAYPKLIH